MTPFDESMFLVVFTGECASSRLVVGWDNVLGYIDYQIGAQHDPSPGHSTVRSPCCELHDPDNWVTVDYSECGDHRLMFQSSEFVYCAGLTITRVTEPLSPAAEEMVCISPAESE